MSMKSNSIENEVKPQLNYPSVVDDDLKNGLRMSVYSMEYIKDGQLIASWFPNGNDRYQSNKPQ